MPHVPNNYDEMHILLIKLKKKNILDPSACGYKRIFCSKSENKIHVINLPFTFNLEPKYLNDL